MGCGASAEVYSPPGTGATEDGPRLVLTSKGAADAIYFEYASALRQSGSALLTLRNGMAVVPRYDYPRKHEEWSYIELGLGPRSHGHARPAGRGVPRARARRARVRYRTLEVRKKATIWFC